MSATTKFSKLDYYQQVLRNDWGLTPNERLVWLAVASYANSADGKKAHPGVERLAADLSLNEKTVRRALTKLVERGLLWTDAGKRGRGRGRCGGAMATEYELVYDGVGTIPRWAQPPDTEARLDDAELPDIPPELPDIFDGTTGHSEQNNRTFGSVSPEELPDTQTPPTRLLPGYWDTRAFNTRATITRRRGRQSGSA